MESAASEPRTIIRPFGDLIILINPAFEEARYEPIRAAMLERAFQPWQRPAMVIVTAENDWATKIIFPLGRWTNSIFEKTRSARQKQSITHTPGHLAALITHVLSATETGKARRGQQAHHQVFSEEQGLLGAEGLRQHCESQVSAEEAEFQSFNRQWRPHGHLAEGWWRVYSGGAELRHVSGSPDNPYWNISATPDVIDGHDAIFKFVFLDFLRQLCDDRLRTPTT
jgi:hypothetical protein